MFSLELKQSELKLIITFERLAGAVSNNLKSLIYKVNIKITLNFQGFVTEIIKVSMGTIEIRMVITALVMMDKSWNHPRCPSADECIQNICPVNIMGCFSSIKKNEIMSLLAKCVQLKIIVLSEVNQNEKKILFSYV